MRKQKQIAVILLFTVAACVFIFKNSAQLSDGISNGLALCAASVIPSLYPFILVSDFIVKSGMSKILGGIVLRPLSKLLKLSDNGCTVFFMSLIGGYPIGSKMAAGLLDEGKLSVTEAKRLVLFCINPSPAFVITMLGELFFGSRKLGIIIYFSCIIASLIIALFTSFFKCERPTEDYEVYKIENPIDSFVSSASSSTISMLFICAWVVIFNAVISVILFYLKSKAAYYICAVLEITNGINLIKGTVPFCVSAALTAFGGLCVHCQVLSDIEKCSLKTYYLFLSRLIHALLTAAVCFIALKLFPVNTDAFSNYSSITANSVSVSFPAAAALIAMCVLLILEVDTNKKMC